MKLIFLIITLGHVSDTIGPFSNMDECNLFKKETQKIAKKYYPSSKFKMECKEIK